jgi:hypothetical protein
MGTITSQSIVQTWGDTQKESAMIERRFDNIQIRANKKCEILAVGICRPTRGRADATVSIINDKDKSVLHEEKF